MSDKEFKKYDTRSSMQYWGVRLAKNAQVKEFGENNFVVVTFVDSSRFDGDEDMWIDANVNKRDTVLASYLEKGDIVGFAGGKLTMRRWGDDNDKVAFNLRNADLVTPPDLFNTLKERGWTPGSDELRSDEEEEKPAAKPSGKKRGRPPGSGKKTEAPKKTKNVPVEIDLDDDEAEGEDE